MPKLLDHPFKDILDFEYDLEMDLIQHRMYGIIFHEKGIRTDTLKLKLKQHFPIGSDAFGNAINNLVEKKLIIRKSEKLNGNSPKVKKNYPNEDAPYYQIRQNFQKWKNDNKIDVISEYRTSYNLVWCYHHLIQSLQLLSTNDPDFEKEKYFIEILLHALKNWDNDVQTKSIEVLNHDLNHLKDTHLRKIE